MSLCRSQTASSRTSSSAISKPDQSRRSTTLHPNRSNPHSCTLAAAAARPPHLTRFPPLQVFGSPALAAVPVALPVVEAGPASENLHKTGREQSQQTNVYSIT